jgi:hypothetical protein
VGLEVKLHTFSNSALDVGEGSAPSPGPLTLREIALLPLL